MIKINLLRDTSDQRTTQVSSQGRYLGIFVLVLALVAAGLYGWNWTLGSQIGERQTAVQQLRQENMRLKGLQAQLRQYEQQKAQLDQRLAVVRQLQQNRRGPVRVMSAIVESIPVAPDIWLLEITQEANNMTILGYSVNVPGIANFMTRLNSRPAFRTVDLDYWEEEPTAIKFQLNCRTR